MIRRNVPLAMQVMNDLVSGIASGEYLHGEDQLLSEGELVKLFNVSRSTIREALSRLEQRGVILRRHGVGTFVNKNEHILDSGLEHLESINTLADRLGIEIMMSELNIVEREPDPLECEILKLDHHSNVIEVTRLIQTSKEPIAFLIDILPIDILTRGELDCDFSGSVLDILLKSQNCHISHASTDITAQKPLDPNISKKLKLKTSDIVLQFESMLYSTDGRKIDHSYSYFVPGYFKFNVVRKIEPETISNFKEGQHNEKLEPINPMAAAYY